MSGSRWDEPPGGKRQRPILKEPIADRYHEFMGWGNLHYPSVENIVERVDILSAARLAVGMVGMRRAIRGTPNLPLVRRACSTPTNPLGHMIAMHK
jgi:hypothetical protein